MSELTLSVTQLNTYIKNIFDNEELLIGIKVVGEITNFKQSGKAIYFDIKDDNATLNCVAFDSFIVDGFKFGDKVSVKGKLNYYIKGGKLSFVVSKIEKYGIGELYQEYLKLKENLEKEGLFSEEYKKPLPKFVKRVGVVTSRTGAVIRDIIRVKHAKNHCSDIVLYPAKVQGIGAIEEIVAGINYLDNYGVDVIIVARGGGSFEDYQPFNSEAVARAVFNAKTPIVSAIGHENDFSIIDFVADRRASTPSVASEMVFFDENEYISGLIQPLNGFIQNNLNNLSYVLGSVDSNKQKMLNSLTSKLMQANKELNNNKAVLFDKMEHSLDVLKLRTDLMQEKLVSLNPVSIMEKGYIKLSKNNKAVISVKELKENDEVNMSLLDGEISATVKSIQEKVKWI